MSLDSTPKWVLLFERIVALSPHDKSYLNALNFVTWVPKAQRNRSLAETPREGKLLQLETVQRSVEVCELCRLHKTRNKTVFGAGNESADWLFVGEAPGAEEDRRGAPFVGRAGQLLDAMIFSIGMKREDVYVANVLKCRPPDNRDPLGLEVQHCQGYLRKQIELIQPRLIIALGRFAAQALLNSTLPIGKLRGRLHSYLPFEIPLVATYHPAYLLRSPLEKRKVWGDLILAKTLSS